MAKAKRALHGLEDADSVVRLLTGKSLAQVIARAWELWGPELEAKRAATVDDPYAVLGLRTGANRVVVKAAFRALARVYHPDTGTSPDPAMMARLNSAYDRITKQQP